MSEEQERPNEMAGLSRDIEQLRFVASDRLMWLRLLEKAINDIDTVVKNLKTDINELSQQVAVRNASMGMDMNENEEEEWPTII